jgi:hypothetical protein
VKLTTHLHLEPRSRIRGAMPLLPNTSSWSGAWLSTGTTLPLQFYLYPVLNREVKNAWSYTSAPHKCLQSGTYLSTGTTLALTSLCSNLYDFAVTGYPSELYYRGSAMWETLYGMICAYPIVIFVFVPVYYSLGITSVYQVTCCFHRFYCFLPFCSQVSVP